MISEYEADRRQPSLTTLSTLISATGHRLTTELERTDAEVRGLPDTASGRRLRQHRRALLEAVASAGGRNLRVFGSVARGEDGPSSDVDLLVDLPEGTGLFALLELEGTLECIVEVKVDLAPESTWSSGCVPKSSQTRSPCESPRRRAPRGHDRCHHCDPQPCFDTQHSYVAYAVDHELQPLEAAVQRLLERVRTDNERPP